MGMLGAPHGLFDLNNSDNNVGSYITEMDTCDFLNIKSEDLDGLKFISINGCRAIDERDLQSAFNNNNIKNAPNNKSGNARISLDEYILIKIIQKTYPTSIIEHQVKWGRKKVDLRVTVNGVSKIIEFHGPFHFIPRFKGLEDPFIRKKQTEDHFKIECIIWPYWIQRCSRNVRAIFEDDVSGLGALWSAGVYFNKFHFSNSAEIIENISDRFKAKRNNSIGYFYEKGKNTRIKPEHPIIDKVIKGKKNRSILLPKGFIDKEKWLPDCLL